MKKILGFDVSSSTIGWCAIDWDETKNTLKFSDCGYYKPTKKGTIIERIVKARDDILKIIDKVKPDYIGIEDIIQFMQGKSTAQTIIVLTTFNRMICLLAHDYLEKSPELFSVMTIRHGLKKGKDLPKKEDMPELVAEHLGIKFPYVYGKKGALKVESYDTADGVAVALYYAFVLSGKVASKAKKVSKKKSKTKTTKKSKKK